MLVLAPKWFFSTPQRPHVPMLTAAEAAARLGVQRATLYAYVSRGLVTRRVAADGRTSVFDPAEIDALRAGRRRTAEGEVGTVVSTAITRIDDTGLWVRGQDLSAAVASGASYETVAELVWSPRPPVALVGDVGADDITTGTGPSRDASGASWTIPSSLRDTITAAIACLPDAGPIDRVRLAVTVASAADPLRDDLAPAAVAIAGRRMIVAAIAVLSDEWDRTGSVAERLWRGLGGSGAGPAGPRVLDAALALLVDHGLATSTFGARLAASVRADPYSVVLAGLGIVGGALHGAASAAVHELLADVAAAGPADPRGAVGAAIARHRGHPGFGHVVYRTVDPRAVVLGDLIAATWASDARLEVIARVHTLLAERADGPANVDFTLGALTWLAGMAPDAGEAIFAIARIAGWLAHAGEEYGEEALRFRPRARYVG